MVLHRFPPAELADVVGETQRNIAYWEQADKPPRSDVIPKLASVLGVSPATAPFSCDLTSAIACDITSAVNSKGPLMVAVTVAVSRPRFGPL